MPNKMPPSSGEEALKRAFDVERDAFRVELDTGSLAILINAINKLHVPDKVIETPKAEKPVGKLEKIKNMLHIK